VTWIPEEEALSFDIDEVLREVAKVPRDEARRLWKRNKAAAARYLKDAARRGVQGKDLGTEAVLWRFRRDVLREAGVDERLVRLVGA
jgi:hypothetical protein